MTQELNFQSVKRSSSRRFGELVFLPLMCSTCCKTRDLNQQLLPTDAELRRAKPLHFEEPGGRSGIRTKEAAVNTLKELVTLASAGEGQKRTGLFHQLVSSLRVLRNETLSQAVAEMVPESSWLTFQALFQCGTSECTSAILQVIWSTDGAALEVDALVYMLGLQAGPDAARVRDMLSMAQYKQSKAIMYALANTVKK